jgi:hypothetical protein
MAREVKVAILGNAKNLQKAVDDANGALGSLGSAVDKIGGALKGMAVGIGVAGAAFGGAAMAAKPLVDAASDLNESISKVGVIFGEQADPIRRFAAGAAKSLGMSERAALDAASMMATFGKAAGLTGPALTSFSSDMVTLSGDLASFFNSSPDEAMEAIGAALRGESEPIRKYGVLLDDATLRARALAMGLTKDLGSSLTPAQRALAAQAEILAQTTDAQGDFARTADGAANKQRILAASVDNLRAQLGQKLLPIWQKVLDVLLTKVVPAIEQHVVPALGRLADWFEAKVIPAMQQVVAWVQANWPTISSVITTVIGAVGEVLRFLAVEVIPRVVAAVQSVVTWVQDNWPRIQEIASTVFGAVAEAIGVVVAYVQKHWPSVQETISSILGNVQMVVEKVVGFVQRLWETFGERIVSYAKSTWDNALQVIGGALEIIQGIVDVFVGVLSGDWSRLWDGIKNIAAGAFDGLKGIASQGLNILSTTIGLAKDGLVAVLSAPFSAARDAIVGTFGEIREAFRTAINWIIGRWNGLSFDVPDFIPGLPDRVTVPQIPMLADGGVVTRPTLAMIGESGPEAVVPLSRAGAMGSTVNLTVNAGFGTDGRRVAETIVSELRRWERANGGRTYALSAF